MPQVDSGQAICVACGHRQLLSTVRRTSLPVMQNLVYPSVAAAVSAPQAPFELATCLRCGFTFNAAFDPTRLVYDERYDNRVPSDVFREYYGHLAARLHHRHGKSGGLVVEIGCGKGEFLSVLARAWTDGHFLGVDPGYEPGPSEMPLAPTIEFVKDAFKPEYIRSRPALVICRHTLEHIPDPSSFLRQIQGALPPGVPLYLEVPDLSWIVSHGAFWDFCYEHCNYFTAESLAFLAERAGWSVVATGVGFGEQYLWLEAISGDAQPNPEIHSSIAESLLRYAEREAQQMVEARLALATQAGRGVSLCIWGMATKGVVFSFLLDPQRDFVRYRIDVNPRKQGRYTPASAHLIDSPEVLRDLPGEVLVLVMNPNYLSEIQGKCRELGIAARFADAHLRPLPA
jgi:hypothetical protein